MRCSVFRGTKSLIRMPKSRVQVKALGAKKANDMARVFQEIFKPNAENVHIYISKINDISKHYKKIALILRHMNDKITGGALYRSGRVQLNDEDKAMLRILKEIKTNIKQEISA